MSNIIKKSGPQVRHVDKAGFIPDQFRPGFIDWVKAAGYDLHKVATAPSDYIKSLFKIYASTLSADERQYRIQF